MAGTTARCAAELIGILRNTAAMHCRCVVESPILHQDAGSALVRYPDNKHANYSQNCITRQSASQRCAINAGELATCCFDFMQAKLHIFEHQSLRADVLDLSMDEGHFGADRQLAEILLDVIRSRATSMTPLIDRVLSAATCLAFRASANKNNLLTLPPVMVEENWGRLT